MLSELYIKNFALIDELRIGYDNGLNVITGETGSGKSIIIDALSLALGKKGSKSFVKTGRSKAIIEAVFSVENSEVDQFLNSIGIDFDDQLIITRELTNDGKSVSRVNGRIINQSNLRELTSRLIAIHGQHEYEQFLTPGSQLKLIDSFGALSIQKELSEYVAHYQMLLEKEAAILSLNDNMDSSKIARELDFLSYEIAEISKANIKEGEREKIKESLDRFRNIETIRESLSSAYNLLYKNNTSVLSQLSKTIDHLEAIDDYANSEDDWLSKLNDAYYIIEDIAHEVNPHRWDLDYSESEVEDLNRRLDLLNSIHKKYGATYSAVMTYLHEATEKKDTILSRDKRTEEIQRELSEIRELLNTHAKKISSLRKEVANTLREKIQQEISSLNMKNVRFEIEFSETELTKKGIDHVLFLVSFNKGEPLKPFSQVASGGEISRFMLAFKTVIAKSDDIASLIFDEIDTGVSGISAQKIGEKLKEISRYRQVICITHLPQIASCAGTHILVEKSQDERETKTIIEKLNNEARIKEIAKMMSGVNVSDHVLKAAEDLIIKNGGIEN